MKKDFFQNLTKYTSTGTIIILIAAIIIIVNILSLRFFGRVDITEDKAYSLSQVSKNTVSSLDDIVTVKAFFTDDVPPTVLPTMQYARDILNEYDSYSSNLKVLYLDPTDDEDLKKEAQSLGISEIPVNILEKDKYQVQNVYFGIALLYGDKSEVIPLDNNLSNLEYKITSAIKKITSAGLKKVGFLTGHKEHGIFELPAFAANQMQDNPNDYTVINKLLSENYETKSVNIKDGSEIKEVNTLVIAGPQEDLSDREKYEIDQFIMTGGNVIFLLDQYKIDNNLQITPVTTGLEPMISAYGLKINKDLVVDSSNEMISFTNGNSRFIQPYPFWIRVLTENLNQDNPITSKMKTLNFPWPSSVGIVEIEGVLTEVLASSSEYNELKTGQQINLFPDQEYDLSPKNKVPLVVQASGKFKSYFAGQPVPEAEATDTETITSTQTGERLDQSPVEGKLVLIGNSMFLTDSQVMQYNSNAIFFSNIVDALTLDSDLITIRAKSLTSRPIEQISEKKKTVLKVINIVIIPIIIIGLGVVKYFLRRKKKVSK